MLEWRSLISEDMKSLSLGRVAFWIALSYSTWFWFHPFGAAFPPALLEFLYATLAYNLGKNLGQVYQNTRCGGLSNYQGGLLPPLQPQRTQQTVIAKTTTVTSQDDISEEDLENTKPSGRK